MPKRSLHLSPCLGISHISMLLFVIGCNQHPTGVRQTTIDLHTVLQPTNSTIISRVPVTGLQSSSQSLSIEALGQVDYDTRRVETIAARVSGRIEKLYVKYRYQHVHTGDKLMDIYSPELVTAQQDLLFILHNDAGNTPLLDAARTRLQVLGMDARQLQLVIQSGKPLYKIAVYTHYTGHIQKAGSLTEAPGELFPLKEGMYIEKGQPVFQLYNTDESWITLNLFPDQSSLVSVGAAVTITPETAPDQPFQATISYVEPFYREDSKTLTARVYFDNSQRQLPIGSQIKAVIRGVTKPGRWLPREAVLSLGLHKVVLKRENGIFKVNTVQTSTTTDSLIQITGGLTAQDSVAADAQFLLDSDSFIKVTRQL